MRFNLERKKKYAYSRFPSVKQVSTYLAQQRPVSGIRNERDPVI